MPCRHGIPFCGIYSASKAAVQNLTEALRLELQPFKVTVVYVAPGVIASDMSNTKNFLVGLDFRTAYYGAARAALNASLERNCANPTPTSDFARRFVAMSLQPRPPAEFAYGKMSWPVWFILAYLPRWVMGWMMYKDMGLSPLER